MQSDRPHWFRPSGVAVCACALPRTAVSLAIALAGITACWELPPFGSDTDRGDSAVSADAGASAETACPEGRCLISGSITDDQHWHAENVYILRGLVLVGDGERETRITIAPGTRILGERQTTGMLVIQRHAKLYAEGAADAPIVFTSDQPGGDRRRGDWGGIVINGNAPVNGCEGKAPCARYGEAGTGWYGGDDKTDNSGVLSFVRIEHAGKQLGPAIDHGGLSLRGVGSTTTIHHLHLHLNENDGVTVVGGTVDMKHVLSTGSSDDGFSWTGGWRGRGQYIVIQQYDDAGNNGIEAANHPTSAGAAPASSPELSNLTVVGVPAADRSDIGILLRDGTRGEIRNSIVTGFGNACLDIDNEETWQQAASEALAVHDTIIDCESPFNENQADLDPEDGSVAAFFYRGKNNHVVDPQLVSPFSRQAPSFAPGVGSPAARGTVSPADSFFDGVHFLGAVDPEGDWTQATWIAEALNGTTDEEVPSDAVENALSCTGNLCIASGTFTSDMRWTADKRYLLRGGVFIGDGESDTNLIIDPGTVIQGEAATIGFLVIQRNASVTAVGTPTEPIVFTSDRPEGARERGDWGGVIINGNAPINGCGDSVCESWGEGGTGWYGGTDPGDSSGELAYVRIEFAGRQLGPDNELNGLALQGVGSRTSVSHIHLHMNKDDAIEFFGGTVAVTYILATGTGDDSLDWTQGWRGHAQFFVAQQYWDAGDNGIEADNNSSDNGALPIADPYVANFTLVGVPGSDSSDIGVLLREGTRGTLVNGAVLGFGDACLDIDHPLTWRHAADAQLRLRGVIMDCAVPFKEPYPEVDPEGESLEAFFLGDSTNRLLSPGLDDPFDRETPRFAPLPHSPATSGAVPMPLSRLEAVGFIGGVDPENDWVARGIADGWISLLAR